MPEAPAPAAPAEPVAPAAPAALLSRIEDASLNASVAPRQLWLDGWLVRLSPGKAQRARSVQALADGVLPLDERLAAAARACAAAGVPLLLRVTPFSRPQGLDGALAARGWTRHDETCVLWRRLPPSAGAGAPAADAAPRALPEGIVAEPCSGAAFAAAIGSLRASPPEQVLAHAERLQASPVPCGGLCLRRGPGGALLACAQAAQEEGFVGLYDVHTAPQARGIGLAQFMCERLLAQSSRQGAEIAYLQVDAANAVARRLYARLGFVEGYRYHYRVAP